MTGDAVSASVAHEVKNPLSAMMISADTGLLCLNRTTPDVHEAKEAFKQVVLAGNRAAAVIESIRAAFKKDVKARLQSM
jgi:C4-dicarboxylate-specific signal transduction histidine kinase